MTVSHVSHSTRDTCSITHEGPPAKTGGEDPIANLAVTISNTVKPAEGKVALERSTKMAIAASWHCRNPSPAAEGAVIKTTRNWAVPTLSGRGVSLGVGRLCRMSGIRAEEKQNRTPWEPGQRGKPGPKLGGHNLSVSMLTKVPTAGWDLQAISTGQPDCRHRRELL